MSDIAIIVAMQKELDLLLPLMKEKQYVPASKECPEHYTGVINGVTVAVAKCGIGKVNAALRAQRIIDTLAPKAVVNTGVAGGTGSGSKPLDVIVGKAVVYHDVWCGPGTEWGVAAGCPDRFAADSSLLALPSLAEGGKTRHGLICSGDIFVSRKEEVDLIKSHFPEAMAVDMESGAIAQTCHMNNTPFISIRVISDTPGEADNISQYENFWEDAPRQTFEKLEGLISDFASL